jgi:hypothetical protein
VHFNYIQAVLWRLEINFRRLMMMSTGLNYAGQGPEDVSFTEMSVL